MNISDVQSESILTWVENKLSESLDLDIYFDKKNCTSITVHDDEVAAVIVFSNYSPPATVEMSIYSQSPKWCTRQVLRECFRYCFETLNVRRIYTQVKGDNENALKMNKRLGFKELAVLPEAIVSKSGKILDNHIFTMTKSECKWL